MNVGNSCVELGLLGWFGFGNIWFGGFSAGLQSKSGLQCARARFPHGPCKLSVSLQAMIQIRLWKNGKMGSPVRISIKSKWYGQSALLCCLHHRIEKKDLAPLVFNASVYKFNFETHDKHVVRHIVSRPHQACLQPI